MSLQAQHPQSEGEPPLLQQQGTEIKDLLCLHQTHIDTRLVTTLSQLGSEILGAEGTALQPPMLCRLQKLAPETPRRL